MSYKVNNIPATNAVRGRRQPYLDKVRAILPKLKPGEQSIDVPVSDCKNNPLNSLRRGKVKFPDVVVQRITNDKGEVTHWRIGRKKIN